MAECPAGPDSWASGRSLISQQASRHPRTRRPAQGAPSQLASDDMLPKPGAGRAELPGDPNSQSSRRALRPLAHMQELSSPHSERKQPRSHSPHGQAVPKPTVNSGDLHQGLGHSALAQFPQVPRKGSPAMARSCAKALLLSTPCLVGGWQPVSALAPHCPLGSAQIPDPGISSPQHLASCPTTPAYTLTLKLDPLHHYPYQTPAPGLGGLRHRAGLPGHR